MLSFVVEEIPEGGLEWTGEMPPEWVDPLLGPQFHRDGHPLMLSLTVQRRNHNVVVRGHLTGMLAFTCSRCAGEAAHGVDIAFTHVFVARSHHLALPDDFDNPADAEFTFFEGRKVEVEPLVSEEFVLSMPWFPICRDGCRGLCPRCGQNLNEGNCTCDADVVDPRWMPLKDLKLPR